MIKFTNSEAKTSKKWLQFGTNLLSKYVLSHVRSFYLSISLTIRVQRIDEFVWVLWNSRDRGVWQVLHKMQEVVELERGSSHSTEGKVPSLLHKCLEVLHLSFLSV